MSIILLGSSESKSQTSQVGKALLE